MSTIVMNLQCIYMNFTNCKNTDIFYIIKTVYVNGKQKTKTIEKI